MLPDTIIIKKTVNAMPPSDIFAKEGAHKVAIFANVLSTYEMG
jgi:hypothetical protein